MVIPRKAYNVVFGEICHDKKEEWDVTSSTSKTVMAETAERAIEIGKGLLATKEKKTLYVASVNLIAEGFDAD